MMRFDVGKAVLLVVRHALFDLLHFPVPVRPQADPHARGGAVDQRDGQAEPQPVQLHALPEREPETEGDADHVICAQVQKRAGKLLAGGAEDAPRDRAEAVEDLEERDDGQDRCHERDDLGIVVEQIRPRPPEDQEHRAPHQADAEGHEDRGLRGDTGALRLFFAEQIADSHGRSYAQREGRLVGGRS